MLGKNFAPVSCPGLHDADSNSSFDITSFVTEAYLCFVFGPFGFGYLVISVRELTFHCQPTEVDLGFFFF